MVPIVLFLHFDSTIFRCCSSFSSVPSFYTFFFSCSDHFSLFLCFSTFLEVSTSFQFLFFLLYVPFVKLKLKLRLRSLLFTEWTTFASMDIDRSTIGRLHCERDQLKYGVFRTERSSFTCAFHMDKHEEEKRDSTIAYTAKESSTDMDHNNILATPGHTPGRVTGSIFEGHFDEGEAAGCFQEALLAWRGDTRPKMGEMESTSLLDGLFDETEAAVIFQEALLAWCGGGNVAATATAACGIAWCNNSCTWSLVAAPQCLRFAGPSDIAGARDSLNFVSVMLLSKFVCPDSEICFESNLTEGCTCLGFCETRNQTLFRNVSCVVAIRISGVPLFFVVCPKT